MFKSSTIMEPLTQVITARPGSRGPDAIFRLLGLEVDIDRLLVSSAEAIRN